MIRDTKVVDIADMIKIPIAQRRIGAPFSSTRSEMWYDNDSDSGEDKGQDGDTDSLTSAESSDSVTTPESSPPHLHLSVLHGDEAQCSPTVGAFDADGNWAWSTQRRAQETRLLEEEQQTLSEDLTRKSATPANSALNRHDRTHVVMTCAVDKLGCRRRVSDTLWSDVRSLPLDMGEADHEDQFDVMGFTSYPSPTSAPETVTEGHSIVVPVRISFEDDSSSDESESSIVTTSSTGSESEARRLAGFNMLQRLGRTIAIPQRRAFAVRLGQGAPRRPPSLDEISSRVVAGGCGALGQGLPPGSAVPHQRSVSCPSPLPLQCGRFGEVRVMVTPPTPRMSTEKISGVVLKSPHMPSPAISTDSSGNLLAPAFDVAPGRKIMLEERERQAKEWLAKFKSQQQERQSLNLKLGPSTVAPPMANSAQAVATITPSSPTRSKAPPQVTFEPSNDGLDSLRQQKDAPPIPPRRRSFARRLPVPATTGKRVQTLASNDRSSAITPVVPSRPEVPERVRSPINVAETESEGRIQPTARRSLAARMTLRRSSTPTAAQSHPKRQVHTLV